MPTKTEIRDFSVLIEKLAVKLRCNRIDAILQHCKETGMEIELASSLVSPALKAKLKEEAQDLNLIKKTSKLPL
jgi:hypothetical protein